MKIFKFRSTPFIAVLWFGAIWFLHQDVVSQSFLTGDALVDINDGALIMRQDYMGFYLGDQKIGFSEFVLKEDSDESQTKLPGKYFIFNARSHLRIQAMGMPIEVRMIQSGEVNEDLSMRSFRSQFESSGQQLYSLGVVDTEGLHLTTRSEGENTEQLIQVELPIYHTEMVHLLMARDGLEVGKTYSYRVFDPLTMSQGVIEGRVESREPVTLPNGETQEGWKAIISYKGMETTVWMDKNGERFKENTRVAGIAFTALKESKEEATDMNFVAEQVRQEQKDNAPDTLDLIESSRIKTEVQLKNPAAVERMEVKVINAGPESVVLDGHLQKIIQQEESGFVLAIQQADYEKLEQLPAEAKPFVTEPNPELEEYLRDEALVQSSNTRIMKKALEITQDSENRWQASKAIADWLYKNIAKEMRATIPSALEILNTMKGDCNEHSTLFAAMARSIGIPAKIVAGLVYQDDGFYYHAWNEVYIDGQEGRLRVEEQYDWDVILDTIYMPLVEQWMMELSNSSRTEYQKISIAS